MGPSSQSRHRALPPQTGSHSFKLADSSCLMYRFSSVWTSLALCEVVVRQA